MSLAKPFIQLQSFAHCLFRFDGSREVVVTIAQGSVRQSIVRIFTDGLLVMFDPFLHAVDRKLVEVVTTLQIKLIGFGALGVTFYQSFLLIASEFQTQLLRDFPGNRFLHREEVRRSSDVLRTEYVAAILRVDQFNTDRE